MSFMRMSFHYRYYYYYGGGGGSGGGDNVDDDETKFILKLVLHFNKR